MKQVCVSCKKSVESLPYAIDTVAICKMCWEALDSISDKEIDEYCEKLIEQAEA